MEQVEMLRSLVMSFSGGWGAASGSIGYTVNALKNRVYEKRQTISLHDAMVLADLSGTDIFPKWVASQFGGTFVKLPEIDRLGNDELLKKFQQLQVHLGELSKTFIAATADGEVDRKEKQQLDAIACDIHKTLSELMAITYRVYCPNKGKE